MGCQGLLKEITITYLTSHATEHQRKVKCSSLPLPNPDRCHICAVHRQLQGSQPHHPPLSQQVIICPAHKPLHLPGTTPHRIRSSQLYFPGLWGVVLLGLVEFWGFRVEGFFKHVSEAAFRSQAPALGEIGEAHESFWKCQVRSFQSSPCHPRIAPTSQRNKRLLKLGRAAHPCSSVK